MKNLFTFLVALFATAFMVDAQTILFSDDFQTGMQSGYTILKADNGTLDQQLAPLFPAGKEWNRLQFDNAPGEWFIASTSRFTTQAKADRWIILPQISLEAATDNWLFYSERNGGQQADSYEVLISTTGKDVADFTVLKTQSQTPSVWTEQRIDLSAYAGDDVYIAFRNTSLGGYLVCIDNISVAASLPFADAEVRGLDVEGKAGVGVPFTIKAEVVSRCLDSLGSVDLNWSIDGGTVHSQTISNLDLPYSASRVLTHTDKWTPAASDMGKTFTLKVWTSNPNGEADANPVDDTISMIIPVGSGSSVPRKVLFEEFTTARCQFCPDGHRVQNEIMRDIPNVIPVNHHSCFGTDAMTNNHASAVCNTLGSNSAPTGMVDRILFPGEAKVAFSRGDWKPRVQTRANQESEASVKIVGTYDSTSREVDIKINTEFVDLVPVGDIRVSLMIIEDGLTGVGQGWDQINAYNGVPGHPAYGKGNPVRGYIHDHVLRDIKPSTWGDNTIIPNSPEVGVEYSAPFKFTLDAAYNHKRVSLVAVVSYTGNGDISKYEVINADQYYLFPNQTGIVKNSNEVELLNIYPNPANEQTNVEVRLKESSNVVLTLRDITGKVVYEQNYGHMHQGAYNLPIDVSSFSNGFYFVNVQVNDAILSRKMIVNK